MKLTISRVIETSRFLATAAGKELSEFVTYTADLAENTLRALRGGLNFADNFDCQVLPLSLRHGTEQIVETKKTPVGVIPIRVLSPSTANAGLSGFQWWVNAAGKLVVKPSVIGTPTEAVTVTIVCFFS